MSYSTVQDVVRSSGIFTSITNESVGTGDASTKIFSLANKKVVTNSEKVYVDKELKTRSSDYTIDNTIGEITFLASPANNKAITAHYKYIPTEASVEDIESYITIADAEIEKWTGKKWSVASYTEYFSGRAEKITATDSVKEGQYWDESEEDKHLIMLSNYPIVTITSLQYLDDDGTVDQTLTENTDFHFWDYGKIWIFTSSIPTGHNKKKVKVVYTAGYSEATNEVKELSAIIASMQLLISMIGGSFIDITSYTITGTSVSVGEPYMNLRAGLEKLEERKNFLMNAIGREVRQMVV